MPIEYEKKFVLKNDLEVLNDIMSSKFRIYRKKIRQDYIEDGDGWGIRIRTYSSIDDHTFNHFQFNYKKEINGDVIEIENFISEEDYNKLLTQSIKTVTKNRYVVRVLDIDERGSELTYDWEIDFFYNNNELYFIMAELELMDKNELFPIPNFISNHLLYAVPDEDRRFTSKKLSNPDHAKKLYEKIIGGNV